MTKRCRYCGKVLTRHKYAFDLGVGLDGKPRELGYLGDNTFCTKTCGYHWALQRILVDKQ